MSQWQLILYSSKPDWAQRSYQMNSFRFDLKRFFIRNSWRKIVFSLRHFPVCTSLHLIQTKRHPIYTSFTLLRRVTVRSFGTLLWHLICSVCMANYPRQINFQTSNFFISRSKSYNFSINSSDMQTGDNMLATMCSNAQMSLQKFSSFATEDPQA